VNIPFSLLMDHQELAATSLLLDAVEPRSLKTIPLIETI
jgi:hypothetical protein